MPLVAFKTETQNTKNWKEMNQLTKTETKTAKVLKTGNWIKTEKLEKSWKTETELKLKLKSHEKLKLN